MLITVKYLNCVTAAIRHLLEHTYIYLTHSLNLYNKEKDNLLKPEYKKYDDKICSGSHCIDRLMDYVKHSFDGVY